MSKREHHYNTVVIVVPAVAREGITKQVANQITGLQQVSTPVCLVVLAKSDMQLLDEYGVTVGNLPVLQLYQSVAYLSQGAFLGAVRLIWPILTFLKSNHAGIVVAHGPYAHFVMRLVKLIAPVFHSGFRLICYFHGLQYTEYPVNTFRRRLVNELNKWLALRTDDSHISVSQTVKKEISEQLIRHQNHTVIYNSEAPANKWLPDYDKPWSAMQQLLEQNVGKFTILLPGRIDANKGQLFFLKVLHRFIVSSSNPVTDVAVFIAGDGPLKQEVEKQVAQLGLQKVITLVGPLQNAVMQKLMQEVELVVVPSFIEGLPLVVLEALQQQATVLASDIPANREIIRSEKMGILFKAGDVMDSAAKLQYLYLNRNKKVVDTNIIAAHLAENFSHVKHMQQLKAILYTT